MLPKSCPQQSLPVVACETADLMRFNSSYVNDWLRPGARLLAMLVTTLSFAGLIARNC
jgi:hypothetical protein